MKKLIITAVCFVAMGKTIAQENPKVEPLDSVTIITKAPLARKDSGKIVAIITQKILENSKGKSVAQLVNEVAGIEINGSSSNEGQNLGYFVRGGRNRQVIVVVDGVSLYDPSHISNDYDLRLLMTESIERIEIIKGASSVLYGSGAATAVISITTKAASNKPISATFSSNVGTNSASEKNDSEHTLQEFNNAVAISGSLKKAFYQANFSNRYVNGLSAIAAPEGEKRFDPDVFNRFNGRINLGYRFNKEITMSQFFSFDTFKADFDDFGYMDADHQSITHQLNAGGHFEWKYKNGVYVFNDNFSWIAREVFSSFPAKYDSKSYTIDSYIHHKFTKNLSAIVGLNYNKGSFNSFTIPFGGSDFEQVVTEDIAKFNSIDPYLTLIYSSNFGLNINAGARLNLHSVYDSHVVYNLNPSYSFDLGKNNLKVMGSYSTAYITPSLYQLYDPLHGNETLQPEENTTMEGGIVFSSENNFDLSVVYFNRIEDEFVDFLVVDPELFIYQYVNTPETFEASGVEVEVSKKFGKKITATANYTNTQADERFALRIPEHKLNATLGVQIMPEIFVGLSYQFNSEREDTFFNPSTFESESITLESYGLFDVTASTKVSSNLTLFATINNLLNEEYEELYRYQTRGRNIRAGFSLAF